MKYNSSLKAQTTSNSAEQQKVRTSAVRTDNPRGAGLCALQGQDEE